MRREEVGEDAGHGAPVLHDVGHPGRRAQVVLEHPEVALVVPDQVDARDVDADAVGWDDAGRLAVKVFARGHQPARDDSVAQDLLIAVDVVEVHLERLDPLLDALFQLRPLGGRDDPGHQIQRKRPFLARQRERDALVGERAAERFGPGRQLVGVRRRQLGEDALVETAHGALGVEHLVVRGGITVDVVVAVETPS